MSEEQDLNLSTRSAPAVAVSQPHSAAAAPPASSFSSGAVVGEAETPRWSTTEQSSPSSAATPIKKRRVIPDAEDEQVRSC